MPRGKDFNSCAQTVRRYAPARELRLHSHGAAAMRLVQIFEHEWSIRDSFSELSLQTILWESISLLGGPGRDPKPSASI
jgi:hypothetical protein